MRVGVKYVYGTGIVDGANCRSRVGCVRLPLFGGQGACNLFGDLGGANVDVRYGHGGASELLAVLGGLPPA